jgi:hypothetical protein
VLELTEDVIYIVEINERTQFLLTFIKVVNDLYASNFVLHKKYEIIFSNIF